MGTEERCGRGEPQRAQQAGRRAQLKASTGLRSTRAIARQREVSDGGTSNVSEPESLSKTNLPALGATRRAPPWRQYTRTAPRIPCLLAQLRGQRSHIHLDFNRKQKNGFRCIFKEHIRSSVPHPRHVFVARVGPHDPCIAVKQTGARKLRPDRPRPDAPFPPWSRW
jgi:hypothetical protein